MSKEYAQVFFDSWMALHRNQKCFQIYSESGYQLERGSWSRYFRYVV